jgi:hypothetical protein
MMRISGLIQTTVLVIALPFAIFAQKSVKFDTYTHLKGFDAADLGEYSILYDTESYKEREGQRIKAAELAKIRAEWQAHRREVGKHIDLIKSDRKRQGLFEVRKSIHRDSYLQQVDYRSVERLPFLFVIQRPNKDSDGYYSDLADGYAELLGELNETFLRDYAKPLGLKLRENFGYHAIAILSSRGAYSDYMNAQGVEQVASRAHYQFIDRLAVTWEMSYQSQGRQFLDEEKRAAILHEFVHQLQHAWHSGKSPLPTAFWYVEGLAEYLSVKRPIDFANSKFLMRRATGFADALLSPRGRKLTQPLEDLIEITDMQQLMLRNLKRAGPAGLNDFAVPLFYMQSFMFIQFLEEGASGAWRDEFRAYMKAIQGGTFSREAWNLAFGKTKPADLEAPFLAHIAKVCGQPGVAGQKLGGGIVTGFIDPKKLRDAEGIAGLLTEDGKATKRGLTPPLAFDHTSIVDAAALNGMRIQAALGHGAEGDLKTAKQILEGIDQPRARREYARLSALLKLRDAFVTRSVAEGWRIRAENDEGKRVSRKILGQDEQGLILDKEMHLAWDELGSKGLRRELRKRKLFDGDRAWVEDYLQILAGQKTRTIAPGGQRLAADADSLRGLLPKARSAGDFLTVFDPKPIATPAAARSRLRALKKLLRQKKNPALPEPKVLRTFARFLAATGFDGGESLLRGLKGEVKDLGKGRFSVRYDFSTASQLTDFTKIDYLNRIAPEKKLASEIMGRASVLKLNGGALIQSGAVTCAWKLPLKSSLKIEAKVKIGGNGGEIIAPNMGLIFGDNGEETFIHASPIGSLIHYARGQIAEVQNTSVNINAPGGLQMSVVCDGSGNVASTINGAACSLRQKFRRDGRLLLRSHTDYELRWEELVITGKIDEANLGVARDLHITNQLKGMGL